MTKRTVTNCGNRTVSTEGTAFAALLDRITQNVEPPRPPALSTAVKEQLAMSTETARRSATAARIIDDHPSVFPEAEDTDVLSETVTPVVFRKVARNGDKRAWGNSSAAVRVRLNQASRPAATIISSMSSRRGMMSIDALTARTWSTKKNASTA